MALCHLHTHGSALQNSMDSQNSVSPVFAGEVQEGRWFLESSNRQPKLKSQSCKFFSRKMGFVRLIQSLALALGAASALVPPENISLEPRATTPQPPTCTPQDAVINGNFYGSGADTYAPFTLTHTSGNTGCQYIHNSYSLCLGGSFGGQDPDCL